ncbi:unnamed protein product [Mytilus edulis]|uniref:Uncharacterized protein n=1 Tax=Mytilus edulis TaxID=6550 RepID=A0A8S3TNQ2_MYTED|nr:unnamed protein product [Mytilus edulis]
MPECHSLKSCHLQSALNCLTMTEKIPHGLFNILMFPKSPNRQAVDRKIRWRYEMSLQFFENLQSDCCGGTQSINTRIIVQHRQIAREILIHMFMVTPFSHPNKSLSTSRIDINPLEFNFVISDIEPDKLPDIEDVDLPGQAASDEITIADLLSLMKTYFTRKLTGIERNLAETTHDLARKVQKSESSFQFKGNKVQFDFNSDLVDNIDIAV